MISECESCGYFGECTNVRLTNGSLWLCKQCLDEFNAKNPELASIRAELAALKQENERWQKATDCDTPAQASELIAALKRGAM